MNLHAVKNRIFTYVSKTTILLISCVLLRDCSAKQQTTCLDQTIRCNPYGDTIPPPDFSASKDLIPTILNATQVRLDWNQASSSSYAQNDLQYRVLYSTSSSNLADFSITSQVTPDISVGADWAKGTSQAKVVELVPETKYYFIVVAKDSAGNITKIGPETVTMPAAVPPVPGSNIVAVQASSGEISISWGAASDPQLSAAPLKYRVVFSADIASIDTVQEVSGDLQSGVNDLINPKWRTALYSITVDKTIASVINTGRAFSFAVAVCGKFENCALYPPVTLVTMDLMSPAVPTDDSSFYATTRSSSEIILNWELAQDEGSVESELQYKLVKATSTDAIDTIAKAEAVPSIDVIMDWQNNNTWSAQNLDPNTTYYFALLVKDAAGNKAIYNLVEGMTDPEE